MFVDLSEKNVVIAGGGRIAARRAEVLHHFGARIHVIAPQICTEIERLEERNEVICDRRPFEMSDAEGAHIVLAATNDAARNAYIGRWCKEHGIVVNVADNKEMCDFFFPAVVEREEITVGITSGGTNHKKVKEVREKIAKAMQSNP